MDTPVNATPRPLSVTILACVYIAVGAGGAVAHAWDFRSSDGFPSDAVWAELTEFLAIVCGAFLLRGRNWARWLAVAWMAFHVVLSVHALHEFLIHCLFLILIAWLLFRPPAARYFRGA